MASALNPCLPARALTQCLFARCCPRVAVHRLSAYPRVAYPSSHRHSRVRLGCSPHDTRIRAIRKCEWTCMAAPHPSIQCLSPFGSSGRISAKKTKHGSTAKKPRAPRLRKSGLWEIDPQPYMKVTSYFYTSRFANLPHIAVIASPWRPGRSLVRITRWFVCLADVLFAILAVTAACVETVPMALTS